MLVIDCANTMSSVFSSLNEDRKAKRFCDVIIHTDTRSFLAHRVVLSASSKYFQAMFSGEFVEKDQREITIKEEDPEILETVIEYCYTRMLNISDETLPSLVEAFDKFSVESAIMLLNKNLSANVDKGHISLYLDIAVQYNGFEDLKIAAASALCKIDAAKFEEYISGARAETMIELLKHEDFYFQNGIATKLINWFMATVESDPSDKIISSVFDSICSSHFLTDEFKSIRALVHNQLSTDSPNNKHCHFVNCETVCFDYRFAVDCFDWLDVSHLRLESVAGRISKKFTLGHDFVLQFYGKADGADEHHNVTGLKMWPEEDCFALGSYNIEVLLMESPLSKNGKNYRFTGRWCFSVSNNHPYVIYFDLDKTLKYKVRIVMSRV